jgi:hypothetical protein
MLPEENWARGVLAVLVALLLLILGAIAAGEGWSVRPAPAAPAAVPVATAQAEQAD